MRLWDWIHHLLLADERAKRLHDVVRALHHEPTSSDYGVLGGRFDMQFMLTCFPLLNLFHVASCWPLQQGWYIIYSTCEDWAIVYLSVVKWEYGKKAGSHFIPLVSIGHMRHPTVASKAAWNSKSKVRINMIPAMPAADTVKALDKENFENTKGQWWPSSDDRWLCPSCFSTDQTMATVQLLLGLPSWRTHCIT